VTSLHLTKSLPYDPRKDFTPIVAAVEPVTCLVVNAAVPVNSVQELIDYARQRPEAFSALLEDGIERYGVIIKAVGIQPE
jgi:tripartite-type tricarboxylate transporter receptor subunit TctC